MKNIEFESTFGDYLTNPKPQVVKDLFNKRTLREWEGGRGDSSINYENESNSSSLTIMAHQNYVFAILYSSTTAEDSILTEGTRTKEVVHLILADGYFFRDQLVSKETAWQAVEYFMETGRCNPNLQWKDYEVPEVG